MVTPFFDFVRYHALRHRPSLLSRGLNLCGRGLWPERLNEWRTASPDYGRRRVRIISPETEESNQYKRLLWGDYWVRYEMTKALGRMGYIVTDQEPDVLLHLYGIPQALPECASKILWIYSHPSSADREFLSQYDRVFTLSQSHAKVLQDMGIEARYAPSATSAVPLNLPQNNDIVFVGNRRSYDPDRTEFVRRACEGRDNVRIWGANWEGVIPDQNIFGQYIDYSLLPALHASSAISLAFHEPDMRAHGYVSIRVLDILGSGGFCLCEANHGLSELGLPVPEFSSADDLVEKIEYYLAHPEERHAASLAFDRKRAEFSWETRARTLFEDFPVDWAATECEERQTGE